jgi:hypothetical protein
MPLVAGDLVKATGTGNDMEAAVAGTDYSAPDHTHSNPADIPLVEHFVSGSTGDGTLGKSGFKFFSGTVTLVAAEAGHPGILRRSTGSTSGVSASTWARGASTDSQIHSSDDFDVTFRFRLNTNDANTTVVMGLTANPGSISAINMIHVEKLDADTEWFGVCRAANVQTRTAALAVVDTDWHDIRIRRKDAATISFSIDGGAEVDLATNVPSAALALYWVIRNAAAADKTIDMDMVKLGIAGQSL